MVAACVNLNIPKSFPEWLHFHKFHTIGSSTSMPARRMAGLWDFRHSPRQAGASLGLIRDSSSMNVGPLGVVPDLADALCPLLVSFHFGEFLLLYLQIHFSFFL